MNVEERMEQMAMLCRLKGWTLSEFKKELREHYPLGPTHKGPPWDDPHVNEGVEHLYKVTMGGE